MMINSVEETVNAVAKELWSSEEACLTKQLADMVSRNLLVVERQNPVVVLDPMTDEIRIRTAVRLTLKDKEYIERLETENKELLERLEHLNLAFKDIMTSRKD